jgi:hypothetical protein
MDREGSRLISLLLSNLSTWSEFTELTKFDGFRVFNPILHVIYMLTRKIIWFYESTRDFDNNGGDAIELDANVKVRAKFIRKGNVVVFKSNKGLIIEEKKWKYSWFRCFMRIGGRWRIKRRGIARGTNMNKFEGRCIYVNSKTRYIILNVSSCLDYDDQVTF